MSVMLSSLYSGVRIKYEWCACVWCVLLCIFMCAYRVCVCRYVCRYVIVLRRLGVCFCLCASLYACGPITKLLTTACVLLCLCEFVLICVLRVYVLVRVRVNSPSPSFFYACETSPLCYCLGTLYSINNTNNQIIPKYVITQTRQT